MITEAFSEHYEPSMIELLCEIVNNQKPLTIFAKPLHHRCFIGF